MGVGITMATFLRQDEIVFVSSFTYLGTSSSKSRQMFRGKLHVDSVLCEYFTNQLKCLVLQA